MKNLTFKSNLKKYMINNDENCVISVNTADFGIFERAKKSEEVFASLQDEAKNSTSDGIISVIETLDKRVREQINYIFGTDVCTAAFGTMNCFSFCNGVPVFVNFLNAILPEIQKDMIAEQTKAEKNINKYVGRNKK